jgi:OOP family OmpA-OmpF porin
MKYAPTKALALVLFGGLTTAAFAETPSNYAGFMGSYINPDNARQADNEGLGGTLYFGFPITERFATELNLFGHHVDNDVTGSSDENYGLGLDLKFAMAPNSVVNPYLLLGGGGTYEENLGDPPANKDAGDRIVGFANAGGGVLVNLGGSRGAALRLEGKRYAIFSDDLAAGRDHVYDTRVNAGVQFNLTQAEPPPPPPPPPPPAPVVRDSDGDGVPDDTDRCPGTPAGVLVNAYGCPLPPPDSDGDGVIDARDACPDTPRGLKVDERGCAVTAAKVVLRNVNFDFDKATLTPESQVILDGVARGLKGQPTMQVLIEGHTDSKGSDSYNLRLSRARANSVRSYLITQGVEGSRLTAQGFGETQPVASNTSEEGRAENRRVEFKVIKQ